MAHFHGSQSKYELKLKKFSRVAGLIWLGAYTLIFGIALYYWITHSFSITYLIIVTLFIGPILLFISREVNSWAWTYSSFRKGLKGAGTVWYELHKLPDTFDIYQHCHLPGHKDDVDFIVVGPTGIFIVEVKSHDGTIEFDGQQLIRNGIDFEDHKNFLNNITDQYIELHKYLLVETQKDFFIHPLIVFSNRWAKINFGLEKIKHIHVIKLPWLLKVINQYEWFYFNQDKNAVNQAIKKLLNPYTQP